MLYCLGDLVFKTSNLPLKTRQRDISWRHPKTDRIGARPSYQSLGEDEDTITFSGTILPEYGNVDALDTIKRMGKSGEAYMLAEGSGDIFGMFAITSLSESGSYFDSSGKPRKIDFTMTLVRVDEDLDATNITPIFDVALSWL